MLFRKFSETTSMLILLGLVLVVTSVWYVAYRAEAIGNLWTEDGRSIDFGA